MRKKKDTQPKVVEKKLQRHSARGEKVFGFAYHEENLIEIDPRQTTFSYFETLIHEMYHLQFPDLSETQVRKKANKMARLLWSHSYRKVLIK